VLYCGQKLSEGRTLVPGCVWVSKPRSYSNTCKNLKGQHPLAAEIWSSDIVDIGWVEMRQINSLDSGPNLSLFVRRKWDCVDNAVVRLSISASVPEIFAIEV